MCDRMTELHHDHADGLLRYLRKLAHGDGALAEDLLQETMIRAWKHLDDVPGDEQQARRWLFTVARNVAIDHVRRLRARPAEVDLAEPASLPSGEDAAETVVAVDSLRGTLQAMKPAQRAVLTEIYGNGRSVRETAERLGIPEGTVKSRAFYALRALRAGLPRPAAA